MKQYSKKGLYNSYDKNHKERQAEDYYATNPKEVKNILETLGLDLSNSSVLEPCVGGGHMAEAISEYCSDNNFINVKKIGSDIKDRGWSGLDWEVTYDLDYMSDEYPFDEVDWIIMNPPYKLIEPFCIRSLEIAKKGIIMLGRIQFLEGQSRYETILKENPPSDVYVYVDRIVCYKDGDFNSNPGNVQCYAWFIWRTGCTEEPKIHWLRRK